MENQNTNQPAPFIPDRDKVISKEVKEQLQAALIAEKFTVFDSAESGGIILIHGKNDKSGQEGGMLVTAESIIEMADLLTSKAQEVANQVLSQTDKPVVDPIQPYIIIP